jgi:putative ABC transport system permease protein
MPEQLLQLLQSWWSDVEPKQWLIAYLVLLVPAAIAWFTSLKLAGPLFSSAIRATIQLIIIALILLPVFYAPFYLQVALVTVMILTGAWIARERAGTIRFSYWISLLAIVPSYLLIIGTFIILHALELRSNILIPISGMLIGNSVRTVSLNFHKALHDFEESKSSIEAMLIDGAELRRALLIPLRLTLHNSMAPKIDSLKTLGIVHIPGAMAGMMIAGASPLEAAGYQILIFFGIVSISAISAIIAVYLIYQSIFHTAFPHLKGI